MWTTILSGESDARHGRNISGRASLSLVIIGMYTATDVVNHEVSSWLGRILQIDVR